MVQYRNKIASPELRRRQATGVRNLCREFGIPLVLNDDLELALEIGADGVHLGRDDGDPATARSYLGRDRLLGVSCYSDMGRARDAVAAGADYVAFGSVFPSPTKPQALRAPLTLITQAARELPVAVAAIGGITLANAGAAIAAGADLLAVITDLFDAPDLTGRARAYSNLFSNIAETP